VENCEQQRKRYIYTYKEREREMRRGRHKSVKKKKRKAIQIRNEARRGLSFYSNRVEGLGNKGGDTTDTS